MTKGDVFQFRYNGKLFAFNVLELRPGNAVSIVETDMNVDFAPPLDYVEPEAPAAAAGSAVCVCVTTPLGGQSASISDPS